MSNKSPFELLSIHSCNRIHCENLAFDKINGYHIVLYMALVNEPPFFALRTQFTSFGNVHSKKSIQSDTFFYPQHIRTEHSRGHKHRK